MPALDRGRIVEAALEIVDAGGVDALSMRRLAARLRVGPMSLYRHVRNKAELLDLVMEAVAARLEVPERPGDPGATVKDVFRAIRRLLLQHPGMARLLTAEVILTPSALRAVDLVIRALRDLGLDDREAARAFAVLWLYTLGIVLTEQSLQERLPDLEAVEAERRRFACETQRAAAGAYPAVAAAAAHWGDLDEGQVFELGLDLLLAGLDTP